MIRCLQFVKLDLQQATDELMRTLARQETPMGWYYYGFKPYVPVAQRRAQAAREVAKRLKKGQAVSPVRIEGRTIASTFWGKAWCTNLESYSDFANRLPRGRTYVRNGSVVDLKIDKGRIKALVSGSELYEIQIDIAALPKPDWQALKKQCAGKIGTLVELLQGKLSKAVMELVTDREHGLFPKPKEIKMRCSCPDCAGHVQAHRRGDVRRRQSPRFVAGVAVRPPGRGSPGIDRTGDPHRPAQGREQRPHDRDRRTREAIFDIEIGDAPAAKADTKIRAEAGTRRKP